MKKAVVLLSGGLDSAVCLYWAKQKGFTPVALSLSYGQRHVRELRSARALSKSLRAPLFEVLLRLPWLSRSSLTNKKLALPDLPLSRIGRGAIPSTYVPGRNTVFLSVAVSLADAIGAQAVVIGANALDYSGYPDCRPGFLGAFSRAARLGTKSGAGGKPLRVLAPLLRLDKAGIVRLARRLKVPLGLTWSCYAGGRRPCGACDSCKLRAKGFALAGVRDPVS